MYRIQQEILMQKTRFIIINMDCPSEEQLIRLALKDFFAISALRFDIPNRIVDVYHSGDYQPILKTLESLQLGATVAESGPADEPYGDESKNDRRLLWLVLGINLFFFVLEMLTGFISGSMGLVADSLDMLADSIVYALALFAVGGSAARKRGVARTSGYFQLLLALFGILEVTRRFLGFEEVPEFRTMIIISALALTGNAASLFLLQKSKNDEAHIRASKIFTSNDVIINMGVILAGIAVYITGSKLPDLIVGAIVFFIVARGAYRILQISK